jgi:uncharacterized protein with HEPN domain
VRDDGVRLGGIDLEIVWGVIERDLPALMKLVQAHPFHTQVV